MLILDKLRQLSMISCSSSCTATTIFCISFALFFYGKHYSNSSFHLKFHRSMSEIDQPPVDTTSQLTTWVKNHLGSLYHNDSAIGEQSDFQANFNSAFSQNVTIHINHKQISRDDFESEMKASRSALSLPSTIDWKEVLEIPTKSVEDSASAVSNPHPGIPKSTLR